MRGRTAAILAASITSIGGLAATAAAAGGPPPPVGQNGATVQQYAVGLGTPTSFAFGGGSVFEGDGGNNQSGPPNGGVFLLKHGVGTKLPGSPAFVAGLAWRKGTLYVSGATPTSKTTVKAQLLAWSGWNGTAFTHKKVIYTAPKKFQGFNGLAFGPDGRLYVGVDNGLTNGNDHSPPRTPYVYDILSFKPNGKDLRVFATGIRQPWQLAFAPGSKAPFASDLGQDSGAKNPPDFVLKVRRGDNYGFPQCNWTRGSKCKGFAKPFQRFAPHTDIMGLAILGKRLYMTSFQGPGAKGPGEVLSMSLKGGKTKLIVKGLTAPFVGLGEHGGWLYVGELTGRVFRVKP